MVVGKCTLLVFQRAEFWGAILALQACYPCHLGIDNLNVSGTFGRLLDHGSLSKPLPLVKDGILCLLFCTCSMPGDLIR